MPKIHLTKRTVQSVAHPERGQVLFRDNKLRGYWRPTDKPDSPITKYPP